MCGVCVWACVCVCVCVWACVCKTSTLHAQSTQNNNNNNYGHTLPLELWGVRTAGEFPWRGGGDPRRLGGLGIVEGLSSCRQLQPLSPRQAVMLVRVVLLKAVLWAQETLCSVCVDVCGCVCAFMDLFRTLRHRQITCSRQKLLCIFGKHKHTLSTGHL